MSLIPVVNLQDYLSGDNSKKDTFVQQIGQAFEETGFVAVEGHGIPQAKIDKFYKLVELFFSLPIDAKLEYEKVDYAGQRGYTSFGREKAKQAEVADLK